MDGYLLNLPFARENWQRRFTEDRREQIPSALTRLGTSWRDRFQVCGIYVFIFILFSYDEGTHVTLAAPYTALVGRISAWSSGVAEIEEFGAWGGSLPRLVLVIFTRALRPVNRQPPV